MGRKHQQHGDQGQGGLETEQLSLADVRARGAGESVEVRGEVPVDVGVDPQPGCRQASQRPAGPPRQRE